MIEQFYIDGELMDVSPDTSFSLTIRSNVFGDMKDMASNSSYTIRLPRTANNERVLMSVARVQHGGAWAMTTHTARLLVDGVPVIDDGVARLMSAGDEFELSVVWGIYPRVEEVVKGDATLRDLSSTASLPFRVFNNPEAYGTAMARGYFYASYDPFKVEGNDDWKFFDARATNVPSVTVTLQSGKVFTGDIGETLTMQVINDAGRYCAVAPIWLGDAFVATGLSGTTGCRAWCIVDELYRVLVSGDDANVMNVYCPTLSAYLIINTDDANGTARIIRRVPNNPTMSMASIGDVVFSPLSYILPCVSVAWLLDRIAEDYGVRFSWDGDSGNIIDTLVIPCVEMKAGEQEQTEIFQGAIDTAVFGINTIRVVDGVDMIYEQAGQSVNKLTVVQDCTAVVDVQFIYENESLVMDNGNRMYYRSGAHIKVTSADGNVTEYNVGCGNNSNTIVPNEQEYETVQLVMAGTGTINLQRLDEVEIELYPVFQGSLRGFVGTGIISMVFNMGDEVLRGRQFPIVRNLPEVKIIDFVKTLAALTGTYPRQINDVGEVAMMDYTAIGDVSDAVDWSDKIADVVFPEYLSFGLGEWSRKNVWKWKESDGTRGNYDGALVIGNDTLGGEREVMEFPFAASDGSNIPQWTRPQVYGDNQVDDTGGGGSKYPAFQKTEPRIMRGYADDGGVICLTFDGLDMQDIINERYTAINDTLRNAMVVKVKVSLSPADVYGLDETKPIYLLQFASYFALSQLDIDFSGFSTATLIRLVF